MADWRNSGLFSPAERAAFDLAEAMSHTPTTVSDEVFAELTKHFSEAQIVELAATIAMENYRARMNRVFLVEAQGLYRPGPSP